MRRFIFLLLITTLNINAQNIFPDTNFVKVAGGFNFPEGPAWDGSSLYLSNCYSDWIAKLPGDLQRVDIADTSGSSKVVYLTPHEAASIGFIGEEDGPMAVFVTERKADTLISFPGGLNTATNGLAFNSKGQLIACDFKGGRLLKMDLKNYTLETLVAGFNGEKFNRPNDLAFDPKGVLYFTDPKSYDKNNRDGVVYSYNPETKELKKAFEGLAFPNGIAFSNDGKFLFVCESAMERIVKLPVNADGSLGGLIEFIKLPGGDPDGIAFDENGNLYAAHFGGKAIYVINTEGRIIEKLSAPGKKPSNLEFGGKDMRDLYLTEDETNSVYVIRTNIPGKILFSSPLQNK
jgi:gluconolactonase